MKIKMTTNRGVGASSATIPYTKIDLDTLYKKWWREDMMMRGPDCFRITHFKSPNEAETIQYGHLPIGELDEQAKRNISVKLKELDKLAKDHAMDAFEKIREVSDFYKYESKNDHTYLLFVKCGTGLIACAWYSTESNIHKIKDNCIFATMFFGEFNRFDETLQDAVKANLPYENDCKSIAERSAELYITTLPKKT
jgi:hypothetical protein